ncbi:cyclin-dependent kinase 5 activator 1-like [Astyanax mexicanus]|nr:cyclin-dependent kinase 5 activator 1-like [Astyanax mexicanus]
MAISLKHVQHVFRGEEEKKTQGRKRPRSPQTHDPASPEEPAAKRRKIFTVALTHRMFIRNAFCPQLLRLVGEFLCRRCRLIKALSPNVPSFWVHKVDMALTVARAQWESFICSGTVVFLYMLCRDTVSAEVASVEELHAVFLTCLYVSYAYIGPEVGYPARHFIREDNRQAFWKRALNIATRMSQKMLQINISPSVFAQVISDLKNRTDH